MITPLLGALDMAHLPILLVIGFALFAGGLGARLFQKLRIPQVVGYIVIGVVLGRSGFHFISDESIDSLKLFNFFALGVIGFMIGGELKLEVFRKYGKQFFIILLAEGITAFLLVSSLVFGLAYMLSGNINTSLALGLVLGAIASATAPAATVDVLWEYKTRGPLTTAVFALVALDDGLALILYGIASSIAKILLDQGGGGGLASSLGSTAYEIFGAVVLGIIAGVLLNLVLRIARDHDKTLTFILGSLGVVIGLALAAGVDIILASMALGMTVVNLAPRRSLESFKIVERFTPPIYVLFFVIVGARLAVGEMQGWMWILAAAFVIGRSGGKILGAFLGAKWSNASQAVQKYLGMCLFSQAGVAIGLAILASVNFPPEIGNPIIMIVTATTFLVQIIGPPCVKIAVTKAGEVGMNITREDLVESYKVSDVINREAACLAECDSFAKIMKVISETDSMTYPVVDEERNLLGIITIQELKSGLGNKGLADLLVAYDLMQPVIDVATEQMPLAEAMTRMQEQGLEYLPVLETATEGQQGKFTGLLEFRHTERVLTKEIIRRQEAAIDQEQAELIRANIRKKSRAVGKS